MNQIEILIIQIRGEIYHVNSIGQFVRTDMLMKFHDNWRFLGVSTHHWNNHIVHNFTTIWQNPDLAINGYLWDLAHGTTLIWGGSYNGRLPKVTLCYKTTINE